SRGGLAARGSRARGAASRAASSRRAHALRRAVVPGDRGDHARAAEHRQDPDVQRAPPPRPLARRAPPAATLAGVFGMSGAQSTHDLVWRLLPWYVNETLDGGERGTVAEHLATCAACRQEADRCRDLAALVTARSAPEWRPTSDHVRRILARIDAIEAADREVGGWRA